MPANFSHNFPEPLEGELLNNGHNLLLTDDFTYVDGDYTLTVPAGFLSDFNSVPRALWRIFPPWEYPEAGVVHDYLYRYNGVTRKQADQTHCRILELLGCPAWKRRAAYAALRTFGWVPWNRYRKAEMEGV